MIDVPRRNLLRNVLAGLLFSYGWVSFMCWLWLQSTWIRSAPGQPMDAIGLVYPHNEHGSVTYFSALQATAGALIFMTSIPLCFLAMWISPKKNLVVKTGALSVRGTWDRDDPAGVFWWAAAVGAALTPPFMIFIAAPSIAVLNRLGFVLTLG